MFSTGLSLPIRTEAEKQRWEGVMQRTGKPHIGLIDGAYCWDAPTYKAAEGQISKIVRFCRIGTGALVEKREKRYREWRANGWCYARWRGIQGCGRTFEVARQRLRATLKS